MGMNLVSCKITGESEGVRGGNENFPLNFQCLLSGSPISIIEYMDGHDPPIMKTLKIH